VAVRGGISLSNATAVSPERAVMQTLGAEGADGAAPMAGKRGDPMQRGTLWRDPVRSIRIDPSKTPRRAR